MGNLRKKRGDYGLLLVIIAWESSSFPSSLVVSFPAFRNLSPFICLKIPPHLLLLCVRVCHGNSKITACVGGLGRLWLCWCQSFPAAVPAASARNCTLNRVAAEMSGCCGTTVPLVIMYRRTFSSSRAPLVASSGYAPSSTQRCYYASQLGHILFVLDVLHAPRTYLSERVDWDLVFPKGGRGERKRESITLKWFLAGDCALRQAVDGGQVYFDTKSGDRDNGASHSITTT